MLRNLGDILRLPAHGERQAYIDLQSPDCPRSVTAFELHRLIAGVSRGLIANGVSRGDRVGILAANRLEFVASYFGTMQMGAVSVPINYKLSAPTIAHIFRDSEIRLTFCDQERQPLVPKSIRCVNFDAAGAAGFESFLDPGHSVAVEPTQSDLAEILYTSGSTGLPKGVPLNHKGQLWAIANHLECLDSKSNLDSTVIVAPLYHMNGLYFTTLALANRITIISLPKFDAANYLKVVSRYRCTRLSGIPTMFAMMVRESALLDQLDLSSVAEIWIGSAPLTDALWNQVQHIFPNARIRNGFGITEAGPGVFGDHPDGRVTPPLSLGYPQQQVSYKLVGGPTENEGMLALRTPAMMKGYLNLPKITAAKLRDGWYLTGDVVRRDPDGFYYFVGRADDMFVCGGENIYPGELEKMLERHPLVAQAIVVAALDDIKGHIPVAFIVPRKGSRPSVEDIKRYSLQNGPAFAHPRFIVLVEALPESGTYKIDRKALTMEANRLTRDSGRSCAP
jgi:acyl-CoA synthetase (AMP-forming)/AMP-acid ligase II